MRKDNVICLDANGDRFTFTTLKGEAAFHQLREEWETLWEQSSDATQFQRWEWQYLYLKYRAPRSKPRIMIVRDARGCCAALAAFSTVADVDSGLPRITFLGDSSADYHMILCRPNLPFTVGFQVVNRLLKTSNQRASFLDLNNIPEGSWTEAVTSAYFQDTHFPRKLLIQRKTQTYSVHLPGDLETYLSRLGSRSRKDFTYDRRRLEREFAVDWRIFFGDKDLEQCQVAIETIDRARWQQDSSYCDPARRAFLVSLAQAQAIAGIYLAFVLYLNGRPAAYVTGAVVRNVYRVETIGHDPGIARHLSIGKTLNFYAIEESIQRGFSEYDLTRGSESYKKWLGARPHNNLHVRLYRSRMDRDLDMIGKKSLEFFRRQTWLRRFYQRFVRGQV